MKSLKKHFKALLKDESAQGMTEYILILAAIVALGLLFRGRIEGLVDDKMTKVDSKMDRIFED